MLKRLMKNPSKIISFVLLFGLFTLSSALPAWAAPTAPGGLTAITGNSEATLTWNSSAGANWYLLYRSTKSGGPYSFVAQTQAISRTDRGLGNDTPYYYVVTALNSSGQSPYSNEASVTPTTAVLQAPVNVTVVAGNGQASLAWTPVTSAVTYNVYRATAQGGPYTLLTPAAPGPGFTDTGLANGTQYFYVVQTLSTNSGAWSDEVSVIPSAELPAAPTALVATPGSTWARLTWSASAGAAGYAVYRGTTVGGPYAFAGFTPTTAYEENGLSNNTTYYYVVAGVNAKGRGAFSIEQSAAVTEYEMPHAAVLKATLSQSGQVYLSWDNATGAVSYILRRGTTSGGPYTSLGVRSSGYTDSGLTDGTTYYYVVDSLNASETIPRSNEVAIAPVTNGMPPAPGNIAAIPGNTQATVTWNPVPGVTSYNVVIATSPGGNNVGGSGYQAGTSYTFTGLTNGITYYFRVQAAGGSWSAFSAEVSATPSTTLPLAPTNLGITGGNTQLSLTWAAVADATEYRIYRRTEGNPWPATPVGTSTGTIYNDSGLSNGTSYQYLVAAVNASGAGAWSFAPTGTPTAVTMPIAPVNIAVIPGNTQTTVTWDPVPGATAYSVTVATSPGGANIGSSGYASGPSYTITGLTNTETYYFRVQAAANNWSAFSAEVSATPSATLPLAPVDPGITGGNSQLSLTWTAVTGATSYRIYRRSGGNPWPATHIATSTATLYTDGGLSNGTSYQYLVAAVKSAGAGAWSSSTTGTPTAGNVTTAPVNVAATAGYTQATITWDPVPGATAYSIKIATSPGGPDTGGYGYQAGPSFTATGLTNGQTYYFRVQAAGGSWSAFSAEVSATPSSSRLLAPTGFYITSGNTELTLTWSAVAGAGSYKVYRRTAGNAWPATPAATPVLTTFTDTGLVNGTTYYYVVATDTGAWSSETYAIPADTTPPDTTITSNPADPSTSITGDFSFASTKPGSTFQCRLDNSGYETCTSPRTYQGLAAGSHTFNVKATDNVGNVDWSPASYSWMVNTTITVPTGTVAINSSATVTDRTPVTLTLTCTDPDGCSQMQFSNDNSSWSTAEAYGSTKPWTLASGDGIKTVYVKFKDSLGYWSNVVSDTITLNTAGKTLIVNRTGTGKGTVTSTPAGINCGTACQNSFATNTSVTLSAAADAGSAFAAWGGDCSGISSAATIVVNDLKLCTAQFNNTAPAPAAPGGLTAIIGNGEASLTWNPSAGASWYLLYRSTTSGGPYSFVAQTQAISRTDRGLGNGTPYYYVVTALNSSGQSPYSNEASVTPTTAVLQAPINVTIVAGNGQASLAWNGVTSEVVYNVYRATAQGGPYTLLTPAAPGPGFTDTGLANGTQYFYVVQTLSTNSGAWSDEVSVIPSAELPAAPTALVATPGSTWARLTWSASAGATGYAVYRGTTVGGPYSFAGFTPTTAYEENGLGNNTTYYYVVAGVNAKGRGAFSIEQSAAVTEYEMPHAAVLKATLSNSGQVYLSWDNATGAVSYILRRGTTSGGPYTSLGVRGSGYTDSGLTDGTTYYYVVDSLNASETIPRSNEVAIAPVTNGMPPAPGNIAAIPGNTQATVTWNPVPGVTSYNVVIATSPGGNNVGGSGYQAGTSYTFTGLTNGITYYFRVQAAGGSWSAFSAEVSATPSTTLPLAPTNLGITGGNTQLSLTWAAVADATEYRIYRRTEGNPWPATPVGTSTGTIYNDSELSNGTSYQYLVAAVNASGAGAWSFAPTGTPTAVTMPIAPVNIAVIPGNTQTTVTWDPVPGATAYSVTVATSPGGANIGSSGYASGPSYTITGLTNTETYYFRVQAAANNWSAFSAEVSATPSATLPLAPVDPGITGGNSQLSLTWTAVTGATSYRIYRRSGGNPWPATHIATSTATLYTDGGLSNGTSYQYLVAAVKSAGAGAWSSSTTGTPTAGNVTTAPVNVAATAGYTQATITWDPVPGATAYSIKIATSPGGPDTGGYGYQAGPSFTATGLTNGQTYYFRVQAAGGSWSAFSAEVSATPSSSRLLAPTGFYITSGIGQLVLNWTTVEGATAYKIYRRTDGSVFTLAGSSLTNVFTDTGLTNGTRYYYVVETVNLGGPGAWSSESWAIPLDAPLHSLTTIISGSGSINNVTQPPPFSCVTPSCTESFNYGTSFTLEATPSSLYSFGGWTGGCTGTGDCTVTLTADTTVTATFTRLPLVQVFGDATPYYTLQSAYDATPNNAVFKARDLTFSENFTLNRAISVLFQGGLGTNFTTVNDYTTLQGKLTIRGGSLTVERLVIE